MELEHGLAQLVDRLGQRRLGPPESRTAAPVFHLLELVADGEEVLDRVVVELLCEDLPLALLGAQSVGEEALPYRRELGDLLNRAASGCFAAGCRTAWRM